MILCIIESSVWVYACACCLLVENNLIIFKRKCQFLNNPVLVVWTAICGYDTMPSVRSGDAATQVDTAFTTETNKATQAVRQIACARSEHSACKAVTTRDATWPRLSHEAKV